MTDEPQYNGINSAFALTALNIKQKATLKVTI